MLRLALLVPLLTAAASADGYAQVTTLDGMISAVWGDPHPESGRPPVLLWYLTDAQGRTVQVELESGLLRQAGGLRGLDGRRVSARGVLRSRPAEPAAELVLAAASLLPAGAPSAASPQLGSKSYAVLLCKFADVAIEQQPPAFFATLMGQGYPNMQHYYGEISNGQLNFNGTQVFGWFTLPQPRSYYATSGSGDLGRLASDCTAAADASVNFAAFAGIALQFNANFTLDDSSGSAWGGGWGLALDGGLRSWPMVWMPKWAIDYSRYGGYAHELGHSLGLPHSSGPYGNTYDSNWDLMSRAWLKWDTGLSAYVPGHTIAFHKNMLGWIPAGRRLAVSSAPQTFDLAQHENPGAGSGPMYATVPVPGTQAFYTIEARQLIGYDAALPGAAVIIHRVPSAQDPAQLIDPDNNGDPNDAGAMWLAGESFSDGKGIRVTVNSANSNGWNVTVSPGWRLAITGTGDGAGTVTASSLACSVTSGSVSGNCQAWYYGNGNVTLTATPAANATFTGWSGACAGTGSCVLPMDADKTVTARFVAGAQPMCILTASTQPAAGGTVSGAGSFPCGSSRTVAATANPGYTFLNWSEGTTVRSTNSSFTFTLDSSRTLVANFNPPPGRLLSLSGAGAGAGTVASAPAGINCLMNAGSTSGACSATFPDGSSVSLTATPASGHQFTGWTGCTAAGTSCSVSMTQGRAVTAAFSPQQYTISTSVSPAGAGTVTGGGLVNAGSAVTVTATPAVGYAFVRWTEGGAQVSTAAGYTFTATHSRGLVANFVRQTFALGLNSSGNGSGVITSTPAGLNCTVASGTMSGTCTAPFDSQTAITLTAAPAAGHAVSNWTGCTPAGNACGLVLSADHTVVVTLSRIRYQVSASAVPAAGGTVTGSGIYDANEDVTITATPATGFAFVNWTEGGNVISATSSHTFRLTANRTVVANFRLLSYELTVTGTGDGSGTVTTSPPALNCSIAGAAASGSCAASFTHGSGVTLTAAPGPGHRFAGWSGACSGTAATCQVSMTGARAVVVSFMRIQYAVTLAASPPAGGTTTGAGTFPSFSNVTVTATPARGYSFLEWREGSSVVASGSMYAFELTANRNLTAHFQLQRFALTVSVSGSGSGVLTSAPAGISCTSNAGTLTGTCNAQFDYGTAVTLTITPATGSAFSRWSGCTGSSSSCLLTITDAAAASAALVGRPASVTLARVADALVGKVSLTPAEIEYVDLIGNRNGRLDVGDFLALRQQ